jgi:hypothetical protein
MGHFIPQDPDPKVFGNPGSGSATLAVGMVPEIINRKIYK